MKRKNKNIYIILILVVLFGISIGYAAINRVLTITGNSEVKQNTWDIHFENIQITNGSVTATLPPTIDSSNTAVNFSFMLDLPGDFYEFTVDAVNEGTIDAMIESITKTPELTTEQKKYLNYIIEYQNGEQITSKQLVSKNSFVRIKVRVEFRSDVSESDMPTTNQSLDLGFTLNYVQSDETGTGVKDNGVMKVKPTANGSLDDLGTIVTIGTEQFYTIGTEGNNVKLLSMYNLNVGNQTNAELVDGFYKYTVTPLENTTGMQSVNAKGGQWDSNHKPINLPWIGITAYSVDAPEYPGSIVEGYVNNYKIKLEEIFGVDIVEARLIVKDELMDAETFACKELHECSVDYPWLYSTSYWTGVADWTWGVWRITSSNNYGNGGYDGNLLGVRPVIVISKDCFV